MLQLNIVQFSLGKIFSHNKLFTSESEILSLKIDLSCLKKIDFTYTKYKFRITYLLIFIFHDNILCGS